MALHDVTAGKRPPVVLLHGWPQTWWEWRPVMPKLAERYSVIVPDLRGPSWPNGHFIPEEAPRPLGERLFAFPGE